MLRGRGIGGVVRLRVRVLANGSVASVTVGGGNPILVESASKAVRTWKYAAALSATTEVVAFDFSPHSP